MIRICPERDAQCPNGMACAEPCAGSSSETLTPREKVEREVLDAVFSGFEHGQCEKEWESDYGKEIASKATDAILTALASGSGSGDHAELARLAEAAVLCAKPDEEPWFEEWQFPHLDKAEREFIAAMSPAVCSALLAEIAALRANEKAALKECSEWARKAGEAIGRLETSEAAGIVEGWQERATEAERKLAEAVQIMEPFARMADEEGGYREDDRLAWGLNRCDISWGDLRAVHTFLSKEAERG